MNQDDLLARLNGIGWNDFERKQAKRGVPEDAYKTVPAFANTAGGWLEFGVSAAYVLPALALGVLEMTHPDKPGSSKQRYRLTEQGKALRDGGGE